MKRSYISPLELSNYLIGSDKFSVKVDATNGTMKYKLHNCILILSPDSNKFNVSVTFFSLREVIKLSEEEPLYIENILEVIAQLKFYFNRMGGGRTELIHISDELSLLEEVIRKYDS